MANADCVVAAHIDEQVFDKGHTAVNLQYARREAIVRRLDVAIAVVDSDDAHIVVILQIHSSFD